MKKVLFVTYGGGHGTMTVPVMREVARHGIETVCYALTIACNLFRHEKLPYFAYVDLLRSDDVIAREWGVKLAERFHNPDSGVDLAETRAYLGLSMQDLIEKHGERRALELFDAHGRAAFHQTSIMRRAIIRHKPDVVVTTNSPRSELAAVNVANEMGVPTLSINDLFGFNIKPLRARHITVLTEWVIDNLIKFGSRADEYHVTGNPAFDQLLVKRNELEKKQCLYQLEIDADEKAVLFLDQPAYWNVETFTQYWRSEREIIRDLNSALEGARRENAWLLVRPHPSQQWELFREWMSAQDYQKIRFVPKDPLHPLIRASDLVVGHGSTVMLESLYLRVPVLQLHYRESALDMPLAAMGASIPSYSPEETPALIQDALKGDLDIEKNFGAFDAAFPSEPAAPRIADIVVDLAKNG